MSRWPICHICCLALALVVAIALRLSYVIFLPGQGRDLLHSDMGAYDQSAWNMCQGEPVTGQLGFNGYHPLSASTYYYAGYTYFVALLYAVFGHSRLAVRVVQGIISSVTVALVYWVGAFVFGRRPALVAAWLTAVYLPLAYYAGLLLTETWFLFLQFAALSLWLRAWGPRLHSRDWSIDESKPPVAVEVHQTAEVASPAFDASIRAGAKTSVPSAVAAGFLAGLASITRPVFMPALGALAVGGWWVARRSVPPARRRILVLVFLLSAAAAIAPVTVRNYQIHGRFILVSTNGPSTFYTGHVTHQMSAPLGLPPQMSDAEVADQHRRQSLVYLQQHWASYLSEIPQFFYDIWLSNDFWPNRTTYWQYQPGLDPHRPSRIRVVIDESGGPPFGTINHFPDLISYDDALIWLVIGLPSGLAAALFLPQRNRQWLLIYLSLVPYLAGPFISWPLARYRIPAVPLVFILAGQTLAVLWQYARRHRGADRTS